MTPRRWIAHPGHADTPCTSALRREVVAAFRRGSMDAEGCLRAFRAQGEPGVLPPEALVYLAAQAVADRDMRPVLDDFPGRPGPRCLPARALGRGRDIGMMTAEALGDHGEGELAALCEADRDGFAELVEAGRRYFFPGPGAVG